MTEGLAHGAVLAAVLLSPVQWSSVMKFMSGSQRDIRLCNVSFSTRGLLLSFATVHIIIIKMCRLGLKKQKSKLKSDKNGSLQFNKKVFKLA